MFLHKYGILIGISILVLVLVILILLLPIDDKAGWIQVILALVGVPAIFVELIQLRQAITQKPDLQIGVATVGDMPVSALRKRPRLPTMVEVSRGYAHFYVAIRNVGGIALQNVKIHVEHLRSQREIQAAVKLNVSEFSESKPTFYSENNFDFTFLGSADWMIYPGDTEIFGYHVTTAIFVRDERLPEGERASYPPAGETMLKCTVWARGLSRPVSEDLIVVIKDDPSLAGKL
jgi:hypothetical protein